MPKSTSLPNLKFLTTHVPNVQLYTNYCPSVLDTVGWVIWPVKIVPNMTYNVFGGTLNPTLPTSKCTKWVPKFTNLAPRPITPVAPLGVFCHQVDWTCTSYICTPHIKFLATPVQINERGTKIYKFGPYRAHHTPLGEIFCHPWGGTCQNLPVYKKFEVLAISVSN